MFLRPRVLKRVFLHYELDDVGGDALAIYIVPALAACPRGIGGGGGMHADVEDKGVSVSGVSEGKSQFAPNRRFGRSRILETHETRKLPPTTASVLIIFFTSV